MKLYHVTPKWNGQNLQTAEQLFGEDAVEYFMDKWGCYDSSFAQDQVSRIYFYATLDEAQAHQDAFDGEILEIDASYIEIETDEVEGHICTRHQVNALDIKRI